MFLPILCFLKVCLVLSQPVDFICGTIDYSGEDTPGIYNASIDPVELSNYDPVVFNISFWGVNREDGSSDHPLIEEYALQAVQALNIEFNQYNIFFKYYDIGHLNSDDYYEIGSSFEFYDLIEYAKINGKYYYNSFNVYLFVPTAFAGIGMYKQTTSGYNQYFHNNLAGFIHEIGHNLGLKHTFDSYDIDYNSPPVNRCFDCEQVTRNPADPHYNADCAGDAVPDTAAVPNFREEYCWENSLNPAVCDNVAYQYYYLNLEDCTYENPSAVDCDEDTRQVFEIDVRNYMAYTIKECRDSFTIGQGNRMRQTIVEDIFGQFEDAQTTLASLYEPYRGEYYVSGPEPSPANPPLFQPGFEYRFLPCECDCPEPTEYHNTNFSYSSSAWSVIDKATSNYGSITHPNHTAILINHPHSDFVPQPRRCYDNWNRSPKEGSVTKFNDGVFNTNVTITAKDSLEINDIYLIQNLPQGLYKIEKNYNDGSVLESIIQKENE